MRNRSLALPLAVALHAGAAGAVELGDAERGHAYAKKACAECHAVDAGDELSPDITAPSFGAVADTPGMTDRALIVWLRGTDHPTMPNLMIKQQDLDDVVKYILSLRTPKKD
jgi:mono/diheme cytochrome c family protein